MTSRKWAIIIAITVGLIAAATFYHAHMEGRYRQAVQLTREQAKNTAVLEERLHISEQNARLLAEAYEREKNKPAATFYVQAPTVEAAAKQVEQRINKQDPTLPPAALEKTDQTAVVANTEKQKVDVLKINLDKSWEISAGVGTHRGDFYIPLGVQKNVGKNAGVEIEVHIDPRSPRGISGGEIKWVKRF